MAYTMRGFGVLNCPGDPGCPGYMPHEPGNSPGLSPIEEAMQAQIDALYGYTGAGQMQMPPGGNNLPIDDSNARPGVTSWLNQHAGNIAIAAGAFLGLMILTSAGRRR